MELEGDDTRVRGREIYRPCRVELSQLYLEEASGTDRLLAGAPGWGSWLGLLEANQSLEHRADNMENTQYDLNILPGFMVLLPGGCLYFLTSLGELSVSSLLLSSVTVLGMKSRLELSTDSILILLFVRKSMDMNKCYWFNTFLFYVC